MFGLLSGLSTKAFLVIGAVLGGMVLTLAFALWWVTDDLKDANDDIAIKQEQLKGWDESYKSLQNQLESERAERQRIDALDEGNVKIVKEIEIKEVEVIREITIYKNNPAIVKCTLNTNWVYLHDKATQRNGVSETWSGSPLEVPLYTGAIRNDWYLPKPVTDDIALEVVNSNYAKYEKLAADYITVVKMCTNQEAVPNVTN